MCWEEFIRKHQISWPHKVILSQRIQLEKRDLNDSTFVSVEPGAITTNIGIHGRHETFFP